MHLKKKKNVSKIIVADNEKIQRASEREKRV